jgi:hypothetical protein
MKLPLLTCSGPKRRSIEYVMGMGASADVTDTHRARRGKMAVTIDLTLARGLADFRGRGTIQSQRLGSRR